jgi:hypothetical protein
VTAAVVAVGYVALVWQAGWWGVLAVVAHLAIMAGAVRLLGRWGRRPPS